MSQKRIQAIGRAVHIMELVGNSPRGLRLSQVSDTLNMPKQTVYKIMNTLVSNGLLIKEGRRPVYQLSELMSGLRRQQQLWNQTFLPLAVPVAYRLSVQCDCEVLISQYTGGEVLGRARLAPRQPDAETVTFTGRMCAYGTGTVFQTYMHAEERADFRRRHPLSSTAGGCYWQSYELMDQARRTIRRDRYLAILRSGILRVVLPVPKSDDCLWGAFTLLRHGMVATADVPVRKWIIAGRRAVENLCTRLAGQTNGSAAPKCPRATITEGHYSQASRQAWAGFDRSKHIPAGNDHLC